MSEEKSLREAAQAQIDRWKALMFGPVEELRAALSQPTYDQTALDLCDVCGWSAVVPGEGCLNCMRNAKSSEGEEAVYQRVYETIVHWDEGGGKRSRRELARRIVDLYTRQPGAREMSHTEQLLRDTLEKIDIKAQAGLCQMSHSGTREFLKDVRTIVADALSQPSASWVAAAWRTFDGEGSYDYRDFEGNENYAAEFERRNPRHKGWVDLLYSKQFAGQEQTKQAEPVIVRVLPSVDDLAQFIRQIDGKHSMGAGTLAEHICEWLSALPPTPGAE